MPTGLRAFAAGVCIVACPLCGTAGAAEPPAATTTAPSTQPPRVEFTIVVPAGGEGEVTARILSWFQSKTTVAHATRADTLDSQAVLSPGEKPGIRAWVVLTDPTVAHVFFNVDEPDHGRRYLVSDVPLQGGLDEVGIEQLAQVLSLSAQALWAGNVESTRQEVEEGLRRREADARPREPPARVPQSAPPPAAPGVPGVPPAPDRVLLIRPGVGYTLLAKGGEGITQTLETSTRVLSRTAYSETGASLRAGVLLPHEQTAGSGLTIDLGGVGFGLGFAFARRAWRDVWLTGELGPGLDFVRYHADPVHNSTLTPSSGGVSVRPNAAFRLGARVDAGPLSVGVEALLVVEWLRTHYDVTVGEARNEVLVPGQLQPGAAAWVSW
jgi:hypothetical protein